MLDRTQKKLQSFYDRERQRGVDGQLHEIDAVTKLNTRQCARMAELHREIRPDLSIETGLAYGFSTLPILDAMEEGGYGHHIAIDPGQVSHWHGIAVTAIEEVGLSSRFTCLLERSDQALPRMIAEGKRAQFIFFDGLHYFEGIIADLALAEQLLDVGGLLVINDMWLPAVRSIASFITTNMAHYEVRPEPHENIFVARKVGKDTREWDHFAPFDGAGTRAAERKRSLLDRLVNRHG